MRNSENGKTKRPERKFYVAPALRSRNNEAQDKDNQTSEAANRQTYSLGYRDSSQKTRNRDPSNERFESFSSSFNSRNTSEKSYKDIDSSDFEESQESSGSIPSEAVSDEKINMATITYLDDPWNKERRDFEPENNQTNRILTKHEDYSEVKSHPNHLQDLESNETNHDRRQFYDYDNILDMDALIDDHMKEGSELSSTPNSKIHEQKVSDVAKFDPEEESSLDSTLLNEGDVCETNRVNYSSHSTDITAMHGDNYIPPPVPLPAFVIPLPPIHRLPVSSPYVLSALHVSSQKSPQSLIQLRPSLQLRSRLPSNSSHMSPIPRIVLPPHLRLPSPRSLRTTHMSSYMPPPSLPQERYSSLPTQDTSNSPSPSLPQGRYSPFPNQDTSNSPSPFLPQKIYSPLPPQDTSNSPHVYRRSLNPQAIDSNEQDDPFYIPPPLHPTQQIRNFNQRALVQSCRPSISSANKIVHDSKIRPQDP